jgi:acyl dehydratase
MIFFEDIVVGSEMWGPDVVADEAEMLDYGHRFDPWPMHVDPSSTDNPFGGLIASGGYTIGLWYRSGHGIWNRPDHRWAFLGGFDWTVRFLAPVRGGDVLHLWVRITDARKSSTPGRGILTAATELRRRSDDLPVLGIDAVVMVGTRSN